MSGLTAGSFVIGMFNALAFTGTSFLFRQIDSGGYQKEMRRHNKAMEKLAVAKEAWYENQVAKKDRIDQLHRELLDANKDLSITNKALAEVQKITTNDGIVFAREPDIGDFYEPSNKMKDIMHVASGVVGLGSGYALAAMLL